MKGAEVYSLAPDASDPKRGHRRSRLASCCQRWAAATAPSPSFRGRYAQARYLEQS